jgi:Lower baseplate protein N-terminal domain
MRKACRSRERLSYWPGFGSYALTRRKQEMGKWFAVNDKFSLRAAGTTFFAALTLTIALTLSTALQAQGPALTTIGGTVYRADGTPASGNVLISWPSFQTAEGDAVAAGNLSVTIGPLGVFSVQLAPNAGASPAGTYYVSVFQLDDGTVRTEYWAVPATSPTTIAAVLTTPGTGLGNLAVTQQYVNAAVAPLAVDTSVVHLAGTETITGTKQFTAPPLLPAPAGANDAANKGYVDAAVGNVGSGAYLAIAGGTMTGALNLPADPAAPNQAADRHYVDGGLSAKADLVNGTIPTGELGTGVASAANCLTGNSTWGSCGGGAPAGITYATTALNWTQTISGSLTGGSPATVTLTPCPVGIDTTSGAGYQVLLSGGGNSESVGVLSGAGGCTPGAASGTITFTPFYSYTAGYTISSASSGIQETINAACGTSATTYYNDQCNVIIPSNGPYTGGSGWSINNYNIYGTIFLHGNQSALSGYGTSLNCLGRGPCVQIGDLLNANDYANDTVQGLSFRTPVDYSASPAYAGVNITNTSDASGYATITTATAHNFRPRDLVAILFTDDRSYWGDAMVTDCGSGATPAACTGSSTTFRYVRGATIASQNTPGVVALAYEAFLDNANSTHFIDVHYDFGGELGHFNNFFDMWDDENATIDHFNNNAISLNGNSNWTGSFVFSGGAENIGHQIAPVITLRDSNITANTSNCATVYNSNGLYIENTVCQASGPWQVYSANVTGNYQGAYLKNIYSESNPGLNPLSPARSPFPGLGVAGLIAGVSSGAASFQVAGSGETQGAFATGGTGSTPYSYFIVANDTTANMQTSPMQILNWLSTGSDSIPVRWPRVANGADAITYDVIRMTTPVGVGAVYPYNSGCPGGSGGTCGYVAKGLTQSAACSGLVCTYTDSGSSSTTAYTIKQGNYSGGLNFWPGSLVSLNKSISVDNEEGPVVGIGLSGNPLQVATRCSSYGAASAGGYTTCLASITSPNNSVPNQTAAILTDGAAVSNGMTLTKGRLNFSTTPGATLNAHHIITLIDSQPGLTQSTSGYRPPASANDTWIGTDVSNGSGVAPSAGQLAFGAPLSITNYIAQTGDGIHANWLERLNASLKEFNVPAKFDQSVTLAGLTNGCLNIVSGVIASTGSSCGSGGGGGSVSSVFGRTGVVVAANGDYTVSQVTGAAADAAVMHNTGNETIGGAKTFTGNVTASGNLLLPQGSGYVPAPGGLGLDSAAGLPVVNIGGTTQQIALTSSNISGQAGTALALASTPTQCSGSFATGIAANGNANCSTANVIKLSESSQPAGIPNWGVFWFDSTHHAPEFIDNNGQAVQLGLTNLFNSDPGGDPADNLEERDGTTPQNLRVYSTYTNNTAWDRISLGSEAVSGTTYNVLRSEDATSGNALSLGMHVGSNIKWVFSSDGTLKPISDFNFDIGTDTGQAMRSVFAKTSFNIYTSGRQDFEFANDSTAGTTQNLLAVYNNGATGVQTATTSSTDGVVGIVSGGAGTSGKSVVTWAGFASCNFDAGSPVAGDYVVASTTQAGKCHDSGSTTRPAGVQAIGRIEAGGVRVSLSPPTGSGAGGAVSSVFGRTGAVTASSGDYSVSQVTGAASDSAVVHVAGAETISGAKTFSSDVTLSGNLNVAGNISQTGTGPTQWSGQEWAGTTVTVPSGMVFSLGVGADNIFKCQLSGGTSCMPYVPTSTTVNGHALSANVSVSASDLMTGTLPSAQLPLSTCSWITVPTQGGSGNAFAGTNKAIVWGVYNPYPCVTNNVAYVVGTADNTSNNYALGLYSGASGGTGTLIATTASTAGTTFAPSGGIKHIAWNTSNVTVPAGRIYIALTSNCASSCTALLGTSGSGVTWAANLQVSVGTGGAALPATVTLPGDSFSSGASIPSLIVY